MKKNDMVFKEKIKAELKAYVRFLREEGDVPVKEIVHRCGISRASVYRCLKSANKAQKKSKKHGRPRLIDGRQERKIERTNARLREQDGNFSCHRIRAETGLYNVSLWKKEKKELVLLEKDFRERLRFARKVKRTCCNDFFMSDICFYLDRISFYHKYNPLNDARAPKGKIWRKRKEGLSVTAKGKHVGSGGRVVKMIVAISYGKGVIYCEQYEKLDGNYYADFIRRNFQNMFQKSGKRSKLFVEDNCPILHCAKERKALKEVGGELFPIPKRSGELNPIKNVFNMAKEELQTQAITLNLTHESFEDFARRVKSTLY